MNPRESGQATTIMALFMGLVMLGFIALALDVGYLFRAKRIAQAAADAAAVAIRVREPVPIHACRLQASNQHAARPVGSGGYRRARLGDHVLELPILGDFALQCKGRVCPGSRVARP